MWFINYVIFFRIEYVGSFQQGTANSITVRESREKMNLLKIDHKLDNHETRYSATQKLKQRRSRITTDIRFKRTTFHNRSAITFSED